MLDEKRGKKEKKSIYAESWLAITFLNPTLTDPWDERTVTRYILAFFYFLLIIFFVRKRIIPQLKAKEIHMIVHKKKGGRKYRNK